MSKAEKIVGESEALGHCLEYVRAVAPSDAAVLILGESGVGKELIAQQIHATSARSKGKLVSVNCAAVPRDLFESEFFGHVKGAFTGALRDRAGRFETADQGTLFLDEVGEIPAELQSKLLRVLQQSVVERVGDDKIRQVDVRIVAATNRDLAADVDAGRFRRDLFYRISTFMIEVPPLRNRKEDLKPLANLFLSELGKKYRSEPASLTKQDLIKLMAHDWPGNVRELRNVIERAFVLGQAKNRLRVSDALAGNGPPINKNKEGNTHKFLTAGELAEFERNNLICALEAANWKVYGEGGAAELLQMKPTTLTSRMHALGVNRPNKKSLYTRLGGERVISGIARDLLGRLQADPQLSRFWLHRSNFSLAREEQMLTRYLCDAFGGPRPYDGGTMVDVHANIGVTSGDWKIFQRHLQTCFDAFGIQDETRSTLLKMISEIREDIVSA